MDWSISPDPPTVGPAILSIFLADSAGVAILDAEVELEANMSHPGMSPVFLKAAEAEPGRYTAPLEFTMAGDWFVLVTAELPGGRTLERQIDVPGVR